MSDVWEAWLPADLPSEVLADLRSRYAGTDDPHRPAAEAWEYMAGVGEPEQQVVSVSTGAQSITYGGTGSAAADRARWHRSRSRAYSQSVEPPYLVANRTQPDEVTYYLPPRGV